MKEKHSMTENLLLSQLGDLLTDARRAGADAADAVAVEGNSLSVAFRLGKPEKVERAEGMDIGLRVFIGQRQAIVSSADRSKEALAALVERAVAMAREVPEDPFCDLASPEQLAASLPDLDCFDESQPAPSTLVEWASRAEDAGRAVPGVTNSEGAEASWSSSSVAIAATNGFSRAYQVSSSQIAASVLAGDSVHGMERDYDYHGAVYASDLRSPEDIGGSAGDRAVKRLGARKMPTGRVPVVFDPRVSSGLVGHLAGAINGSSIARGTSFLKDKLGKQILPKDVQIIDDPHRPRGLRSKPCDGEGVANRRRAIVEDGVLTSWILDLRSARQLGMESTGHAARGTGGPPSPSVSNFYLAAGSQTPAELIADIKQGFYVTELIGMGVNGVTGDYSRGAAGFWIENGEIAFPVHEMTIASTLQEMFLEMRVADDLVFKSGIDAPTVRVDGMTVAGA
jgi:PmbA protein